MTFPSHLYQCSECQRTFTSDDTAGHFSYQAADGFRFPLKQRSGWCFDCDSHVPVEDLRTEDLLQEIVSLHQQVPKDAGFFKSLSSSYKHDKKLLTDQLTRLEKRLDLIKTRQSPPKCLSCGGGHISLVEGAGPSCYYPGCKGTLQEQGDPLHLSLEFDHRIYDLEGLLIQVIEDW